MAWSRHVVFAALAALMLIGTGSVHAGGRAESVVRHGPNFDGYHLRPPYYLPGVGWYTPRDFKDRSLYFGYHFHPTPEPKTPWTKKRVVNISVAHVEWCRGTYRTYRASKNAFRTQDGRWKTCRSPYWRG